MKTLLPFISYPALFLTILPAIPVIYRIIALETHPTTIDLVRRFTKEPLWLGGKAVYEEIMR